MLQIKRFTPPDPILPAQFSMVTGYEQQIEIIYHDFYKTTHYVVDSVNEINNVIEQLDSQIKQAVNDGLKDVRKEFANLQTSFDELQDSVNSFETETDAKIAQLKYDVGEQIDGLKRYVDNTIAMYKELLSMTEERLKVLMGYRSQEDRAYTDTEIEKERILRQHTDESLEQMIRKMSFELVDVYNPTRGENSDIQTVVVDLWNKLRYGCLTADEWEQLGMTADEWDALEWTAEYYDLYSKRLIFDTKDYMVSPYTGKKETVGQVLLDMYARINFNGKTAVEYDAIGYTADQFDESTYDAYAQNTHKWYTETNPDTHDRVVELKQLVWNNPDPLSTFTEQTLNVDPGDFDVFEIRVRTSTSSGTYAYSDTITSVESGINFTVYAPPAREGGKSYLPRRFFVITEMGMDVTKCDAIQTDTGSLIDRNDWCIPISIYGIKYIK